MIDELAMLTAYGDRSTVRDALRLLAEVLTQGRAADHGVAGYVQEPTKDVVDVRELFDTRICLGVTAASHVDMALGDGARDRGALADEIPGDPAHAGIGFVIDTGSRLPSGSAPAGSPTPTSTTSPPAAHPGTTPRHEGEVVPFPAPPPPTAPAAPARRGGRVMNTDTSQRPRPHRPPPSSPRLVGLAGSAPCSTPLLAAIGTPSSVVPLALAGLAVSRRRSAGGWPAGCGSAARTPPTALAGAAWRAQHHAPPAAQIEREPGGGGVMWAVTGWVIATWLASPSSSPPPSRLLARARHHSGAFWLICCAALAELLPVPPAPANGPTKPPRCWWWNR